MSRIIERLLDTRNHTAVLGKTGSGKTSTAKLLAEAVVARGARACVLDTIKSDWWGMTSSADGTKPGLPFHILGGPHGHVPLHSGAGRAIGELVGNGKLPLSILDMADFEAGGVQRFFVDFAPALLRSMRGVLYLFIEEAHELAPKERAGFSQENMAIHFAKKLATAGRSKGIRLVVCTQATQALHNRVLGSCETMVVHRFTAPAEQEPVLKWLKANTTSEVKSEIEATLSGLPTGSAWVVSGEAQIFERVKFPRIHTYDNSATPTDDQHRQEVKTAPVDAAKLRAIVGDAVAEAEAKDPKKLQARIDELEAAAVKARGTLFEGVTAADVSAAEVRGYEKGVEEGIHRGAVEAVRQRHAGLAEGREEVLDMLNRVHAPLRQAVDSLAAANVVLRNLHADLEPLPELATQAPPLEYRPAAAPIPTRQPAPAAAGEAPAIGQGAKRRILVALAQNVSGLTSRKLAILTGVAKDGGTWRTYLAEFRSAGWIEGGRGGLLTITDAGRKALGHYQPLPTGRALQEWWRQRLGDGKKRAIFDAVVGAYPRALPKERVAELADVAIEGGTWRTYIAELRGLELVEGSKDLKASADLFA